MGLAFLEKIGNTSTSGGGTGSGDGLEIQGIVEEYYVYAGDNITPGSFVEFVQGVANRVITEGDEVPTTSEATAYEDWYGPVEYSCGDYNAILLDDKQRVFFTFKSGAGKTSARILTFVDGDIVCGDRYDICTNSAYSLLLEKLSGDRIFAFKAYSEYYYLLQVDGLEISQISRGEVQGNTVTSQSDTTAKIDDNHIFVTYQFMGLASQTPTFGAKLITIADDGTMSESDPATVTLTTGGSPYGSQQTFYLGNNNLITLMYGRGLAHTWTVDLAKNTVTRTSYNVTGIIDETSYGHISRIDDNRLLYVYDKSTENLYGKILTTNGTTLVPGEEFIITEGIGDYSLVSSATIPGTTNSLVTYMSVDADYNFLGMFGSVVDCDNRVVLNTTNITTDADYSAFWGDYMKIIFLTEDGSNNFMLFFGGAVYFEDDDANVEGCSIAQCFYLNADNQIITAYSKTTIDTTWETQAKLATSDPFHGIAKTAGIGGDDMGHNQTIQVYTL